MASSGTKFTSANLNKSYGHSSHSNYSSFGGSYGQAAAARGRPGSGGGGGGMVVLSRPRSSQKAGSKLSVPPPLNLPSLRKEHEKFDVLGSGGVAGGSNGTGVGPRPSSSGVGWTKPVSVASQEKDARVNGQVVEQSGDGQSKRTDAYAPPLVRSSEIGGTVSDPARAFPSLREKASVLSGEDFPSLQAALPVSSGSIQKQKDGPSHKQKHAVADELSYEQKAGYHTSSPVDIRPRHTFRNGPIEIGSQDHGLSNSRIDYKARKQEEYFPGPLPLVRLNPRSDWADDERDTGHGFADRGRDIGFSKGENYWDRDFDMPRASALPNKPVYNQYERWGQRDNEAGKGFSSEGPKADSHHRDARTHSKEGNNWRTTSFPKYQEVANDAISVISRTSGLNRDAWKENKYIHPRAGDTARDGGNVGNRDSTFGRRDIVHVSESWQHLNHISESFNGRGADRNPRDWYSTEQTSRYKADGLQHSAMSKSSFTSGGKASYISDSAVTKGPEKRAFSKSELLYEDPFPKGFSSSGFDDSDPFSVGFLGVVKRKKDIKPTDFHDPVRESFEAELERVQKLQELERQRLVEEQEKAMEQARREEEERQRLIRDEEEMRRRLEEEAQQAAWKAEQDRLEAIRKAEEQKIAREEEKRRLFMEEERRKQAAKQKLLELEAKIAKRKAEATMADATVASVVDEKLPTAIKERDISSEMELDNWEESERMVERITTSASFDSSENRVYEMSSRHHFSREGPSNVSHRGKSVNSWRRDVFENGSVTIPPPIQHQEVGHYSPRRDSLAGGKVMPRRDFYGGAGYMPRNYIRGGQEPYVDEFGHHKDQQWNLSGDTDSFNRNKEFDSEFRDNPAEKYGDVGWGQGRYRGYALPLHTERLSPNTEADELYSYGRSRYSMRQPRVLPPPSFASIERTSSRGANGHPGSSTFLDGDNHYAHAARRESTRQAAYYGSPEEGFEPSNLVDVHQENPESENRKLNKDLTPPCDSQSSLSVSSPPSSPPHLSNDEFDELGGSPSAVNGRKVEVSANESTITNNAGKDPPISSSSSISVVEDEEWAIENSYELPQQEDYDDDEDGYQEEDEVREGDDENLDLNREFEDLHLEEKGSSHMVDNLVLGFDDGVEVKLPGDDVDRNSGDEERGFGISGASELKDLGSVKNVQDNQNLQQPFSGSSQMSTDISSEENHENEKVPGESVHQLDTGPCTSVASDLLVGDDASSSSAASSQQTVTVSSDAPPSAGHHILSTSSQADLPVKLQFGLFSGPSLIPSPVPAIQIGSIQMPLHLHPPGGPSLAHIHQSQPPMFQFGQLRYTSPISQGILPMAPQPLSFVQPNVQPHYNLTQNAVGSLPVQPAQDIYKQNAMKVDLLSPPVSMVRENVENNVLTKAPGTVGDKISSELVSQAENKGENSVQKNQFPSSKERAAESDMQAMPAPSRAGPSERKFGGLRAQGHTSSTRGRRFSYAIKNSGMRSNFPSFDSSGFPGRPRRTVQRTVFRVRENGDKRQLSGSVSANNSVMDEKSNFSGRAAAIASRSGSKRGAVSSKASKERVKSENVVSVNTSSQEVESGNRARKEMWKNPSTESQNPSHSGENLKRNISEEDFDAPLQSGVVRVFKQPGIEAPSDEDDFIQVRSKRQMLNDRREQREKEIKARSRVIKPPRKPRVSKQSHGVTGQNKTFAPVDVARRNVNSDHVASKGHGPGNKEVSALKSSLLPQPLAPIGVPSVDSEPQPSLKSHVNMSLPASTASSASAGGKDLGADVVFESQDKVVDDVSTSLPSWGSTRITQQVMALTQTQLEDAMKPVRFDPHITSGGDSSTVTEPTLPSSSILMKDKSFSSSASPINSLLAGEKIQFGAVTSPTVLHSSGRAVSLGVGVPGSICSDTQISHNLTAAETALFLEKDKNASGTCVLQDCEAEAEAAASAVAVAAISSDDTVGSGAGSVSVSGTKSYGGSDMDGITIGMAGDQQLSNQSRSEESLSVSLPADLSVETSPISLWPPLPSPQNSSSQVLSHFPGGPPSHFPFYEMNPLLGGPIFAFGPHEESARNQSQLQKNTPSSSGPPSSWQHSMVDSFYGPPTGFTGPFISPSGGISGVQGPPHMVVYNHFTPVGQFGQVGLSYMGTTYIPSGKQPDWKHNPTSSSMDIGEGEIKSLNMASSQRSTSNMSAPIQHLAPGSPLLRMASPMAMFDVSPFQSAPDVSVQAHWSHVPASTLHSNPSSRPLQQEVEGVLPLQFGHGRPVDQSLIVNKFSEIQTSTSSSTCASFPVAVDTNVTRFPDEVGLGDSSSSSAAGASTHTAACQSSSGDATVAVGKNDNMRDASSSNGKVQNNSSFRSQSSSQHRLASGQQSHSSGYNYARGGGTSQRNTSGSDWPYRRMGHHSRNQSFNSEKGFPSAKVKQIYVAKQTNGN